MDQITAARERYLKCPKGHTLGASVAGIHVVQHDGRTIVGRLLSVTCRCGGVWESPEVLMLTTLLDQVGDTPAAIELRTALGSTTGRQAA